MSTSTAARTRGRTGLGLAAIGAVAGTYVYFLLFAQFGLLRLADARLPPLDEGALHWMLAAMGVTGLVSSLATAAALRRFEPLTLLILGFGGCAVAAGLAPMLSSRAGLVSVALLVGTALGMLTVALATGLHEWLATRHFATSIGLGTGAAYLFCNLPPIFEARAELQSAISAAAALVGLACAWALSSSIHIPFDRAHDGRTPQAAAATERRSSHATELGRLGFLTVVLSFLALIWIDSAAFNIIQETAALKAPTWGSPGQKLSMGAAHFLAALLAGWWIDRGNFRSLLVSAFVLFVVAFHWLQRGGPGATASIGLLGWSGLLYAAGISFYSVALVAYPGLGGEGRRTVGRRWRAGAVYGLSGWLGSALGVGMAQNLHRIPPAFLVASGLLIGLSWLLSLRADGGGWRLVCHLYGPTVAILGLLVALSAGHEASGARTTEGRNGDAADLGSAGGDPAATAIDSAAVERGYRVYVAEGCINCHSQYVRPQMPDVEWWGPRRPPDDLPPLIGNRRQGPDLTNAGNRRSAGWHRLHLRRPRRLSPGSRMPSYAHLFADGRGEDLVTYLSWLGAGTAPQRWQEIIAVSEVESLELGSAHRGRVLFDAYCAQCHGTKASGDGDLVAELFPPPLEPPPTLDLPHDGFVLASYGEGIGSLDLGLARVIRFGIPGTAMPGHEWLPEGDIADLVAWVARLPEPDGLASETSAVAGELPR